MEQDYIDGICDAPFDTAESQNEAAASHQMVLDALHNIGCKYNMATPDIAILCLLAQISLTELMNNTMGANA